MQGWDGLVKVLKENSSQPVILYPVELFFKSEGEIMTVPDKQKLREFVAGLRISEEMLKKVLYAESSWYWIQIQIHIKKQRALLKVIIM